MTAGLAVTADPSPWPYDGRLDGRRLALVIAGDQPAWARRSSGATAVAAVIGRVADAVRRAGGGVVHVRHGGSSWRATGLPPVRRDPTWELATRAEPDDVVVDAAGVDGFFGGPLDAELRSRGYDTLVLAGYGAESAVSSTLRSANDRGYECLTLTDGTAPFDDALGARSLHSITMSGGIFGAIASSDALLAAFAPSSRPLEALR